MFANGDAITGLWQKWTIGRRLIRLLYPTELSQMVGYKVGNKTGVRMATNEGQILSKTKNNPKNNR